jgi:hypothetical protein
VWRLTGSRGAALVAAVMAEMSPYRLARSPGHLNVITTQWFSVALWTFEEYLRAMTSEESRHATRWAVALGLSLGLIALSSWYSAYQASLMIPLYIVLRTVRRRILWRSPSWYRGLALAAGISILTVLPVLVPYVRAAGHGELTRQFNEMQYWSLNFYDFVIPNANHPLLNERMNVWFHKQTSEWAGRAVSLGYVAIALATIALVRNRRDKDVMLPLTAVAIVSASIALGPMVYAGDRPVLVPVSHSAMRTVDWWFGKVSPMSAYRAPLRKAEKVWIPLPSLALWLLIPVTAGMRAMSRFGYWTLLMTAGLAAFGTRHLLIRTGTPARRAVVATILTISVTLESWSIRTVTYWQPRPVDQWIAAQPESDVVLELPASAASRPAQDYFVTVQQHRTILGPRGDSYQPPVLFERYPVLLQLPSDAALATVRSWGATLLIVDSAAAERWPDWEQMFMRAHAPEVARFGETRVYRLN